MKTIALHGGDAAEKDVRGKGFMSLIAFRRCCENGGEQTNGDARTSAGPSDWPPRARGN